MSHRVAFLAVLLLSLLAGGSTCVAASPEHAELASTTALVTSAPLEAVALNYSARVAPAVLLNPARQTLLAVVTNLYAAAASRFTLLPNRGDTISQTLDAMPVIGTVRRRAGRRFNTDDASIDDLAVCYRLSSRLGFQMIPGDPAPVRVTLMSKGNSAGVTVGMTLRLSHR